MRACVNLSLITFEVAAQANHSRANRSSMLVTMDTSRSPMLELPAHLSREGEARRPMAERDEDDWPTAALALTLDERHNLAVWSQDNDARFKPDNHLIVSNQIVEGTTAVGE